MIHSKAVVLPGLLAFGLLPIFTSTADGPDRGVLARETRISQTKTADDTQSSKSSLPGKLSWIRGTVLSWTSDSLTLQPLKQGKKSLTLDLGPSHQIIHAANRTKEVISVDQLKDEETARNNKESLAVGSAVQAHYFEQDKKLFAIVIIEEKQPIPASQEKSGSSYLGALEKIEISTTRLPPGLVVVKEIQSNTIFVRIDGRTRQFYLSWKIIVDSTGHRLAAEELKAGDTLLITYRLDFYAGAGMGPSPTLLEIRDLTSP